MKLLCIETSSQTGGGLALVENHPEGVLEECFLPPGKSQSESLMPHLDRLLQKHHWHIGDLSGVVVSVGPGSFTGIRIGIATAQGLCFVHQTPALGVSSLQVLACNARLLAQNPNRLICTLLDARKSEVYGALYQIRNGLPDIVLSESHATPDEFLKEVKTLRHKFEKTGPICFLGDGSSVYREKLEKIFAGGIEEVPLELHAAKPRHLALLAWESFLKGNTSKLLQPSYVRPSSKEFTALP